MSELEEPSPAEFRGGGGRAGGANGFALLDSRASGGVAEPEPEPEPVPCERASRRLPPRLACCEGEPLSLDASRLVSVRLLAPSQPPESASVEALKSARTCCGCGSGSSSSSSSNGLTGAGRFLICSGAASGGDAVGGALCGAAVACRPGDGGGGGGDDIGARFEARMGTLEGSAEAATAAGVSARAGNSAALLREEFDRNQRYSKNGNPYIKSLEIFIFCINWIDVAEFK